LTPSGNNAQKIPHRRLCIADKFAFLVDRRHLNVNGDAPFLFGRLECTMKPWPLR